MTNVMAGGDFHQFIVIPNSLLVLAFLFVIYIIFNT